MPAMPPDAQHRRRLELAVQPLQGVLARTARTAAPWSISRANLSWRSPVATFCLSGGLPSLSRVLSDVAREDEALLRSDADGDAVTQLNYRVAGADRVHMKGSNRHDAILELT